MGDSTVYVYVCVCVCVRVCIYTHIHTHTHTQIHAHIQTSKRPNIRGPTHACIHTYRYPGTQVQYKTTKRYQKALVDNMRL